MDALAQLSPPSGPLGWPGALAVLAVGLVAGFFNVTAGGGSLLTLPLLILLGLPGPVANGTNRLALIVQNLVAVPTFRRGGALRVRRHLGLLAAAVPGALAGAWAGAVVTDALFRRLLGALMIAMTVVVLARPSGGKQEERDGPPRASTWLSFAGIGLYAGFIQAGVGFLIVFALAGLERMPLVRAHALKVTTVLLLQLLALPVFALHGKVSWALGALLAVGLAAGGFAGARLTLRSGERALRLLLAAAALALSIRLLVA